MIKRVFKRVFERVLALLVAADTRFFRNYFSARLVSHMAQTGTGSDRCLELGCLPMRTDFYSPVPDLVDLERRDVWSRVSDLSGVEFHPDEQKEFLLALGQEFGAECDWPAGPVSSQGRYFTENNTFSYGCAAALHCMIRRFKPRRIIEVGSGFSSLIINEALALNYRHVEDYECRYEIVDPYPGPLVEKGLNQLTRILVQRVELLDTDFFKSLTEGDILFIDSGHTVRQGGDVNFLILDVLPLLSPGVLVHFHDINLPAEYPKVYATNPTFRVFWTEAYLLQAFLCFNNSFKILLAMSYLMGESRDIFEQAFPLYDKGKHLAVSGSFWLCREAVG